MAGGPTHFTILFALLSYLVVETESEENSALELKYHHHQDDGALHEMA